jgi:hypothetical protein
VKLPDDLNMEPRDVMEYARMVAAYRRGVADINNLYETCATNFALLAAESPGPFKRPRTTEPTERAMVDSEVLAALVGDELAARVDARLSA